MSMPAAKLGDKVLAVDIHIVLVPTPTGPVPTPTPLPFNGVLTSKLSSDVFIEGKPAATMGSEAINIPPHIAPQGVFQRPPSNKGVVIGGSTTVTINGKPAARLGDLVITCNDPADLPVGQIVATSTVFIG